MVSSQPCEGFNCLAYFLKGLINTLVVSAENVGVIPWCIFWWFVWYHIHWTYNWIFQSILRRTTINEDKYKLLIKLYWKIAFASLSIPFALENLKLDSIDVSDRFYYVLENHISRWFSSESLTLQTKMSYVILAGYYINTISEVCFEFGLYNKEFILNELFGLFFIATYPLKCVEFGLAVTVLINIVNCFMALADVFTCLGDIAHSSFLKLFLSRMFLFIHFCLWLFVYFHILPVYFMRALLQKIDQRTDAKQLSMFFLLNCTFIAYYILYLMTCPLSVKIYNFVLRIPQTTSDSEESTESVIQENERNRNIRKKENLRMLYHTVKCVIRMKRKLAKMRQNKQEHSGTSTLQESVPPEDAQAEEENIDYELLNGINGLLSEVSMNKMQSDDIPSAEEVEYCKNLKYHLEELEAEQ